jgi:hypothetical protein
MKVELKVNLKTAKGQIISTGTVFSDKEAPIPDFIMRRVERGQAKIIEYDPPPKASLEVVKEVEKIPVIEIPEKSKKKKLLKRISMK